MIVNHPQVMMKTLKQPLMQKKMNRRMRELGCWERLDFHSSSLTRWPVRSHKRWWTFFEQLLMVNLGGSMTSWCWDHFGSNNPVEVWPKSIKLSGGIPFSGCNHCKQFGFIKECPQQAAEQVGWWPWDPGEGVRPVEAANPEIWLGISGDELPICDNSFGIFWQCRHNLLFF